MLTAADVSRMSEDLFVSELGGVVESSPWVASLVWAERPFDDLEQLCVSFEQTIRHLPQDRRMAVIKAHSDLVGRAALAVHY